MTVEQIWDYISSNLSTGNILTAASTSGKDTEADDLGVVKGHAYTISRVLTLEDGTKLVRARNPWGKDSYMGEYGSESPQAYDPKVVAQIPDIHDHLDGYIYVPIAIFKKSFRKVAVNYNPDKMKMDYFLKLDDKSSKAEVNKADSHKKKLLDRCGPNCIMHDLHVVSTKAQKVWVSLNTWRSDTLVKDCLTATDDQYHGVYPSPLKSREYMLANRGGAL